MKKELQDRAGEIWKDVVGYEGLYMVSSYGRVKSLPRVVIRANGIKQTIYSCLLSSKVDRQTGYCRVALSRNGIVKRVGVHRLVAMAFLPNQNGYDIVNHIDWNRTNNNVANLEWCTQQQNVERMNWEQYNKSMNVRPIQQMSLDGKIIAIHSNMKEAAKASGIPHSTISAACRGKYGNRQFIWKRL